MGLDITHKDGVAVSLALILDLLIFSRAAEQN